jgi:UDP-N-acetylmuramyl pentapeptide phosphotransferase/UDP-N-acetylglucosamine-1-phosphate transferase
MIYFFSFILAFLLSVTLSKYLVKLLSKYSIVDTPKERSNHNVATPRGGGLALVITTIILLLVYYYINNTVTVLYVIASLFIVATISFLDDLISLPITPRIILQLISILILLNGFTFKFDPINTLIITSTMFLFINFYNFMDGIDGSAASEAMHISISILVISCLTDKIPHEVQFTALILISACAGFLIFNWFPAKIFLGDVGSIALGLICGWMLISLVLHGYVAAAIIIPLYYIADSSITLLKRFFRGKKIWQAHSEHFFQKAVRKGASHAQVTKKIIAVNLILFVLSIVSLYYPGTSIVIASGVVAMLLYDLQRQRHC